MLNRYTARGFSIRSKKLDLMKNCFVAFVKHLNYFHEHTGSGGEYIQKAMIIGVKAKISSISDTEDADMQIPNARSETAKVPPGDMISMRLTSIEIRVRAIGPMCFVVTESITRARNTGILMPRLTPNGCNP